MTFDEAVEIVRQEREYQDKKWGGDIHDKEHSVSEWILFIRKHLNDAENALYNKDEEEALNSVRKMTALGIAAMEVHTPPRRKPKDDNS